MTTRNLNKYLDNLGALGCVALGVKCSFISGTLRIEPGILIQNCNLQLCGFVLVTLHFSFCYVSPIFPSSRSRPISFLAYAYRLIGVRLLEV